MRGGRRPGAGRPRKAVAAAKAIPELGQELIARLMAELEEVGAVNATLAELIAEEGDDKRRQAMLQAISLPSRAVTVRNLVSAFVSLGRAAPAGKKEAAAARAGAAARRGRFATPPPPPKLIVDNEAS
jgi:hypothetical protein